MRTNPLSAVQEAAARYELRAADAAVGSESADEGESVKFLVLLLLCYSCTASADCLKVGGAAVKVEVAKTEADHAKGLMFREALPENTGMWFVFGHPHRSTFWMKNTFIPLDIIFVSRDLRVLSIFENAKPFDLNPITSPVPYWYVLEVPAGFVKKHQLRIGDRVGQVQTKC